MKRGAWSTLMGLRIWKLHPAVRTGPDLTPGERAADQIRNVMGSWVFVITALVFLTAWMAGNRSAGFDPYPFILLNLVLSCVAAMQGAILLIAAKRSDQIAAELAIHDFRNNEEALSLLRQMHEIISSPPLPVSGEES